MKKLIFLLLFFAFSCARPVYHKIETATTTSDTTRKTKLAPPREINFDISVDADSASITALLECDSLNNVLYTELTNKRGVRTQIKTMFKTDTLKIFADVDSLQIHKIFLARDSIKETFIKETTTPQTIIQPEPRRPTPDWVYFAMFISLFLVIGAVFRKR